MLRFVHRCRVLAPILLLVDCGSSGSSREEQHLPEDELVAGPFSSLTELKNAAECCVDATVVALGTSESMPSHPAHPRTALAAVVPVEFLWARGAKIVDDLRSRNPDSQFTLHHVEQWDALLQPALGDRYIFCVREWGNAVYEVAGGESGIFLLENDRVSAADGMTLAGILPLPRDEFVRTLREMHE
jgi:hypothetical protein